MQSVWVFTLSCWVKSVACQLCSEVFIHPGDVKAYVQESLCASIICNLPYWERTPKHHQGDEKKKKTIVPKVEWFTEGQQAPKTLKYE